MQAIRWFIAAFTALLGTVLCASTVGAQQLPSTPVVASTANNTAEAELDEIVVTGIRGSLARSVDAKRDATTIVDAISAEELGKFPARNVADSLANIPGIALGRTRGAEGQSISIRGLGENFSIVTLNNRILPSDGAGRDFAFDVLPSEMISGAEVFKAVQASQTEGGIGGAVNLRSARPLDFKGLHLSGSLESDYNDLSKKYGVRAAGVVSSTFNDDRVGALLSVSYSRRDIRTDNLREYYLYAPTETSEQLDFNGDGAIDTTDKQYIYPGFYSVGAVLGTRKRLGVTSSLQFKLQDSMTLTLDGLYTRYDTPTKNYAQSNVLTPCCDENGAQRWTNIRTDSNGVVTHFNISDLVAEVLTYEEPRTVDTYQLGSNFKWEISDRLHMVADGYWSEATKNNGGKERFVVAGILHAAGEFSTRNNGLPDLAISLSDGRRLDQATNADYRAHYVGIGGQNFKDAVYGLKTDFTLDLDAKALQSLQFGVAYTNRGKDVTTIDNIATECNFCGYHFTFGSINADIIRPLPVTGLLSNQQGNFPRTFASFDIDAYLAALKAAENNPAILDATALLQFPNGYPTGYATQIIAPNPVQSFKIREKTTAAYAQLNFKSEKWRGDFGLRLVHTSLISKGASNDIVQLTKLPGNVADYNVVYSEAVPKTGGGSYTKVLPSANFAYDFTDRLRLRLAAAEVMARPSFDQLSIASDDFADSGTFAQFFYGEPNLKPTQAKQYDASLEWYFAPQSIVAAAIFYKDVTDFVSTLTVEQVKTLPDDQGVNHDYTFSVTNVVNGDSAKVKGLEISAQHLLDNGFGARASYTYNNSTATLAGITGGFEGVIPRSYNLSLLYERNRISSQVTYRHDAASTALLSGEVEGLAVIADEYRDLSFTFSFNITKKLTAFLEGSNLLDETLRQFSTYRNVPKFYEQNGRSFFLGARARY